MPAKTPRLPTKMPTIAPVESPSCGGDDDDDDVVASVVLGLAVDMLVGTEVPLRVLCGEEVGVAEELAGRSVLCQTSLDHRRI